MRWEFRADETLHLSATDGDILGSDRAARDRGDRHSGLEGAAAGGRPSVVRGARRADAGDAVDEAAHHHSRRCIQRRLGPRGAGCRRYPAGAVDESRALCGSVARQAAHHGHHQRDARQLFGRRPLRDHRGCNCARPDARRGRRRYPRYRRRKHEAELRTSCRSRKS